ncbi:immunoglobulin superfamily member 11-like isoform X2 [Sceloporus undulatus]|uniref:immunoglobulin superfamily member 11-like isoform X2 n=1 Tax=Sceloporus undulatus TaxID=8520 RepID=UPI001C4D67ED|nr:immunoglobulin superfamily member 11-like isoform X2 [Sceloporus undulatus]
MGWHSQGRNAKCVPLKEGKERPGKGWRRQWTEEKGRRRGWWVWVQSWAEGGWHGGTGGQLNWPFWTTMGIAKEGRMWPLWPISLSVLWTLLGSMAGFSGAVKVSVVANSIQVVQGGSALLPCSFHTWAPLDRLNVIWTVTPNSDPRRPQQVLAYERGEVVESMSDYAGRVAFAFSPSKSATIVLNDTRGTDSGRYQCSVINPPDAAVPNIGVVQLTVFVPPSSPKCSREGSQEEGGSLQFSCTVGEGMPMPTFTWEKIPPDSQPMVMTYEDDRRALLTLRNLTADASGLYRCTASNMLGSISCALELHIHVTPDGATSLVVGITLMLTMGLVLLTLFALVLWLHRYGIRKWREADSDEDDSHNEIRIDNFSLGRLIVAKSPSGEGTTANPVAKPLWIFTSSTPNTTYAHREWRPEPGNASQAPLPGGFRRPTPAGQGRWRRPSGSEEQESSSGGSEEKHPMPGHFPKPTGFLV